MIQVGSYLKVVDNSGAKIVQCIHIITNYKSKYAKVGDLILVSIKKVRRNRRDPEKISKGKIFKSLILHTKSITQNKHGGTFSFLSNTCILMTKQNKLIATRILHAVIKNFRFTKFMKILILATGVL